MKIKKKIFKPINTRADISNSSLYRFLEYFFDRFEKKKNEVLCLFLAPVPYFQFKFIHDVRNFQLILYINTFRDFREVSRAATQPVSICFVFIYFFDSNALSAIFVSFFFKLICFFFFSSSRHLVP